MSGPIRISVLADTKDLRSNLGTAEKSLKSMGNTAEKAARDVDQSMSGVGDAVDSTASNASTLAGAFGDVAGGLGLIGLGGFSDELEALAPALMLTAGAADIASVAMNTLSLTKIKDTAATVANKTASIASSAATKAQAAAQWALNAAMSANPIMLVVVAIAALVAGIVIAYKKSETFRNIVNGAFGAVKTGVMAVVDWFKEAIPAAFNAVVEFAKKWTLPGLILTHIDDIKEFFGDLVSFVTGLPKKIAKAALGMFDGIKDAFKGAVNFIIDKWNGLEFKVGGGSILGKDLPSVTLGTPNIPRLARGGITTGPTLAMVGDNPGGREAVIPLDRYDLGGGAMLEVLGKILLALEGSHDRIGQVVAQEAGRGWSKVEMGRRMTGRPGYFR